MKMTRSLYIATLMALLTAWKATLNDDSYGEAISPDVEDCARAIRSFLNVWPVFSDGSVFEHHDVVFKMFMRYSRTQDRATNLKLCDDLLDTLCACEVR